MHDDHILLCGLQLVGSQDIGILQTDIVGLVEEALLLHTGHIQDVQLGHGLFHGSDFLVLDATGLQLLLDDVAGELQLLGSDEDELDAGVASHCCNQGVDGTAELQVAAQADGQALEGVLAAPDGQQVGQGLGGMVVSAVTCVDDGHACTAGSNNGSAFLGMTHDDDVSVAADGLNGVRQALTLSGGGRTGLGEADDGAAQALHSSLEAQSGTGGGLKEQGSQQLVVAGVLVLFGVCDNVLGGGDQLVDLLQGEVSNVHQISHALAPFTAR